MEEEMIRFERKENEGRKTQIHALEAEAGKTQPTKRWKTIFLIFSTIKR